MRKHSRLARRGHDGGYSTAVVVVATVIVVLFILVIFGAIHFAVN